MRLFDSFLLLLSLIGLVFVGWWGVYQSPAGAASLEARLQASAEAALAASGEGWASVEIDGQTARLTGAAPTEGSGAAAAAAALASDGPGGPVFGGVTTVETAFSEAETVSPFVWRAIKTEDGRYLLGGHVPDGMARERLLAAAEYFAPGRAEDDMAVAAGAPDGDWVGAAEVGLNGLSRLDMGSAVLTDANLKLSGVAMDQIVRAEVSAQVANLSAPYFGEPDIRGAGLWRAEHVADALVLSGEVASEAEKQEIAAIARDHYDGVVEDDMNVKAHGHDGWIEGVRLGLPHFARFQSGDMRFDPDGEGFAFDGEASGSTLAYLREDMSKLEGDFAVAIKAETVEVDVAEIEGVDFDGDDPVAACESAFVTVLSSNQVVFESGSADITRGSGATLDKLMAVAGRCDETLTFELGGHTDDMGDRAFNVYLSEQRAGAVAAYMAAAGFDPQRLTVIGYGPDAPIADNETREGRAANRRLEFRISDGS